MTILVDMDDVLEQLIEGWVAYCNHFYGTHAVPADVKNWDMSLAFPTLTYDQVYAAVRDDRLWDFVYPMPGADEALRRLLAEGHTIYVVTATDYETLPAKMEKVLFRYFPYLDWAHVIITQNKQLIHGDVLVDDGPHNLIDSPCRRVLFDSWHNQTFDEASIGAVRVHNWTEAYAALCAIAREKEKQGAEADVLLP